MILWTLLMLFHWMSSWKGWTVPNTTVTLAPWPLRIAMRLWFGPCSRTLSKSARTWWVCATISPETEHNFYLADNKHSSDKKHGLYFNIFKCRIHSLSILLMKHYKGYDSKILPNMIFHLGWSNKRDCDVLIGSSRSHEHKDPTS